MNRTFLLSFLLCIFLSGNANAVIIEGEFGGFIKEVRDRGNYDDSYTTFWGNVNIGDAVHGTFWYDTDLAPTPTEFWNGKQLQYRNYGANIPVWSGMSASIDGRIFDITKHQPQDEWWYHHQSDRGVLITDEADTGYHLADAFSMINSTTWMTGGFAFSSTTLLFGIWQQQIELFNSTKLGQEFSWRDDKADPTYNGGLIGTSGYNSNGPYDAEVRFTVTYANARIRKPAQVNEPGILLLMVLGISSILLRRKK